MRLMMFPIYEYQEEKAGEVIGDDGEPPVYIVDDITSEALFKLMSENNERMSVISAEGGIFGIMAGRYNSNSNGNIDVYLKGHAGDPCSNHRIGRKSQSMDAPCLTMSLAVQRDIIKEVLKYEELKVRMKEVIKYVSLVNKIPNLSKVIRIDEMETIEDAKSFLEKEFNCDIIVKNSDERGIYDPMKKGGQSIPLKPAIYVE